MRHMNKKFKQIEGQVAHKGYLSCVVCATDIALETYKNRHNLPWRPILFLLYIFNSVGLCIEQLIPTVFVCSCIG